MTHLVDVVLFLLLSLAGLIMAGVAFIDTFLASAMTYAGLPQVLQIMILFIVAIWLIALAVRLLGPILSTLVTLLLILVVLHRVFPGIEPPPPPAHAMSFLQSYI